MRKLVGCSLLFAALSFASCTPDPIFNGQKPMENGWAMTDTIAFNAEILDTINQYNFFFLLRHTADYPYRNFYLFLETELPGERFSRDTISCVLADRQGKWRGSGIGDMVDHRILFKFNKRFPFGGNYDFKLIHGMRDTNVTSITNVGLQIVKEEK